MQKATEGTDDIGTQPHEAAAPGDSGTVATDGAKRSNYVKRSRSMQRAFVQSSRLTHTFLHDGEKSIDPSPYQDDMNRHERRAHMSNRFGVRPHPKNAKASIAKRGQATAGGQWEIVYNGIRFGGLIPPVPR